MDFGSFLRQKEMQATGRGMTAHFCVCVVCTVSQWSMVISDSVVGFFLIVHSHCVKRT